MELDDCDFKILKILVEDSRLSSRQIAKKIEVSSTTVMSRIKKMHSAGIIIRDSAILNHEKIGYEMTVVVAMVMTKGDASDAKIEMAKIPNVCCVYDVTGRPDVIVIAKLKTRREMRDFRKKLHTLPGVVRTETHVVLDTLKEDFRVI